MNTLARHSLLRSSAPLVTAVLALDGRRDKNIQLPFRRRGEKPGSHDKFKRAMIGKYVLFSLIRLPDLYNGETGGGQHTATRFASCSRTIDLA
jgi:hypothetical protein